MRKIVVLSFVSLDGVMQAPGGPKEDLADGFAYGGWTFPYFDETLEKVMGDQMQPPFDLLLGRKTYEIFAAHWPRQNNETDLIAAGINHAHKYVVSRHEIELSWNKSILIKGDVVEKIQKLKKQNGPMLQVQGSSQLIQTLLKNDLVDELWLKIFPVTLGVGKRLFGDGTIPAGFRLLESKVSLSGVIIASYGRSGDVLTGSFV
ncbi:MAG: dihydrofolate reductase family protein [Candidatus Saccharibacteria bacterium]